MPEIFLQILLIYSMLGISYSTRDVKGIGIEKD